jgi:SAM-dependent methyltransferase
MSATPTADFDEQALFYDARTGLPPDVGAAVARAVLAAAEPGSDGLVVEIGAGTGEIGADLARLAGRYLGLDRSEPLLAQFQAKAAGQRPWLARADCAGAWPLRDGVAAAVFASRVVHLLDPDHVVRETRRVCRPGAVLVAGRVVRDRDSPKAALRRRRRELLLAAGYVGRDGEAGVGHVVAAGLAAGGKNLGRRVVAEWTGTTTAAAVLVGWEPLTRMGGVTVEPVVRADIFAELRRWAKATFGDLDRPLPFRDGYAIDVVRLSSRGNPNHETERSCKTTF